MTLLATIAILNNYESRSLFFLALGEPTAVQRLAWPAIAAGQHTLILVPTGSGKTLAAFLALLTPGRETLGTAATTSG